MLKKIVLKNFMSHRLTELELVDGVNVLIGPNNCGKSAIVSALQIVAELPTREGEYMIRHGETEAQVLITTGEGDEIIWGRKGTAPYLVINGTKHSRLSNNQEHYLNELHKVLRLPRIKNKDDSFDIHFAKQKEPIFLLNEPPTRAATFFSISSEAGRLLEVRELFKNKVAKAKEKQKSLQKKQIHLERELERISPLATLRTKLLELKDFYLKLMQESDSIVRGFEDMTQFSFRQEMKDRFSARQKVYDKLIAPPEITPVDSLEKTLHELIKLSSYEKKLLSASTCFATFTEPYEIEETTKLEESIGHLMQCSQHDKLLFDLQALLAPLSQPQESLDIKELHHLVNSIEFLEALSQQKRAQSNTLSTLLEPYEKEEIEEKISLLQKHTSLQQAESILKEKMGIIHSILEPPHQEDSSLLELFVAQMKKCEQQENNLEKLVREATLNLEAWIAENPSCPTCGSPLEIESEIGTLIHA